VLHDVEEQVAAAAHAVEVIGGRQQNIPVLLVPIADYGPAQRADSLGVVR
jgi:hypothetical protein